MSGISFNIDRGETIALVGESGSGKSVSALSVMQLLPYPLAHHPKGSIKFNGEELIGTTDKRMRQLRGDDIAMIFQEPLSSLNPLHSIEKQISEVLLLHKSITPRYAPVARTSGRPNSAITPAPSRVLRRTAQRMIAMAPNHPAF